MLDRAAHARYFDTAEEDLHEALALANNCGFTLHLADIHLGRARLALARGSLPYTELSLARGIIHKNSYNRRRADLDALDAQVETAR